MNKADRAAAPAVAPAQEASGPVVRVWPGVGYRPGEPWAGHRPGIVRSGFVLGASSRCWIDGRGSSAVAVAPAEGTVADIEEAPRAAGADKVVDKAAGIAAAACIAAKGLEQPAPAVALRVPPVGRALQRTFERSPGKAPAAKDQGLEERHHQRTGPWATRIPCRTCLRARDGFRSWGRASEYERRLTINRLRLSPDARPRSCIARSPPHRPRPEAR